MSELQYRREPLGGGLQICVNDHHRFGTDALLLAEFAQVKKNDIACDLGTGCGIIPLILHRMCPPQKCYAVDIQPEAISLLQRTMSENELPELVPLNADLCHLPPVIPRGTLTLVTCNPPYQASGAGKESADIAHRIARHEICCSITDVCAAASGLLRFGGRLCLCSRPERLCDVICAMRAAGIEPKRLQYVAKNEKSEPWLFLIEGKKGAKPFLRTAPVRYTQSGGVMSEEMTRLYRGDVPRGTSGE